MIVFSTKFSYLLSHGKNLVDIDKIGQMLELNLQLLNLNASPAPKKTVLITKIARPCCPMSIVRDGATLDGLLNSSFDY